MSHSACREDAEAVAALIEEQVPQLKGKIEINDIGTLIGSHTGPGTVALFFMGDKRVDYFAPSRRCMIVQTKTARLTFVGRALLLRLAFLSAEEEAVQ